MRDLLESILAGQSLKLEQARALMNEIMQGNVSEIVLSALLVALRQKGETPQEIAGFAQAMRANALKVELYDDLAIDGCGTGGDGTHTFNISTAAALVTSGAGITVAKHGNRSVSSNCGSADILEACGANIDPGVETVQKNINSCGFGFMFAPRFHPAMRHAMPVRRTLGIRTLFNILGPLTNPAGVTRQVIGVYDNSLIPLMAEVGRLNGLKHLIVARAQDGLDEFSISAPTDYAELKDDKIINHQIVATDVGLAVYPEGCLAGTDAEGNKQILYKVLQGEKSPYRDAVVLNSAMQIYVSSKADSIQDGVSLAADAIDSGKALAKLEEWVKASVGE